MTIQEEIRKEIARVLWRSELYSGKPDWIQAKEVKENVDAILKYLDERNVIVLDRDIEEAGVAHMERLIKK